MMHGVVVLTWTNVYSIILSVKKTRYGFESSGQGAIPYRRYSPRAVTGRTGVIPVPTVKSGWKKYSRGSVLWLQEIEHCDNRESQSF